MSDPPPPPLTAPPPDTQLSEVLPGSPKATKKNLRWNGPLRIALLQAYLRYAKKQIGHDEIRAEFTKKTNINAEMVPKQQRLMNLVSDLKKKAIEAADLHEDVNRVCRTPTDAERHKELLSGKRKELSAVYKDLGVDGDGVLEHEILTVGNELKLDRGLSESKKNLDKEASSFKEKSDALLSNLLQNREFAKRVRQERRKIPSRENEEDEEASAPCGSPSDPDWDARRPRNSLTRSDVAGVIQTTKDNLTATIKAHNTLIEKRLESSEKRMRNMEKLLMKIVRKQGGSDGDEVSDDD